MQRNTLQERYAQGDRNFQKVDLSGADLSALDLRDADFRGADLYGAKLVASLLNRADFSDNANLAYANLNGADLREANLSGANLEGADLEGAIAQGTLYDPTTVFPIGFDPVAAGGIAVQELDRQSRLASVAQLKTQAAQNPVPQPQPIAETARDFSDDRTAFGTSNPAAIDADDSGLFPSAGVAAPPTVAAPSPQRSRSCLGTLLGMFLVLGLGFAALNWFDFSKRFQPSTNPFNTVRYPRPACGDPLPTRAKDYPVNLYPVFVRYSPATLKTVTQQFCRDAFATDRSGLGVRSIQVASFTNQQRATQFARFMMQKVGSGEVGASTRISR
ncbi:pentapeptide repeat-containing protein [Altericista sp. CCNU0014]|uniref:pentapeptide repeat-containing protein n=1 Tax=Altericista sp. CCNU0014 TaxID=3082949 RepID=UPI0038517DB3